MTRGLIVMGLSRHPGRGQEGYTLVAEMVRDKLGFDIIPLTPETIIPSNTDLIISRGDVAPNFIDLDKKIKVITWLGDVNLPLDEMTKEGREMIATRKAILERSDLVISSGYSEFKKSYPQFMNKMVFFPKNFGTVSWFCNLKFNKRPRMKCLLPGSSRLSIYPLRNYIKKYGSRNIIDIGVKISNKRRKKGMARWPHVGEDYAKWINSYFCCVTSSSIFNYVIGKYFEIAAAGSLLLANETEDSKRAGFIPYVHFIPITKENALSQIKRCLKHPERFNGVRKAGMQFVRENHSVYNRFEQLKKIIREVLER